MKFWRKSLRARLLAVFLLLAVIPLSVISYLSYEMGRQRIIKDMEERLQTVAILKEQEIQLWLDHLEHTVLWLGSSPSVSQDAATLANHGVNDPAYFAAHNALTQELSRVADLAHLSPVLLLDTSGQVVAASNPSWEGQFREDSMYFANGKKGIFVSEIFHSLKLGRSTMVISTPVRDSGGRLVGVLAGHANLESLNEIMQERSGLGESGKTYLVNKANLLLTGSRFQPGQAFKKWIFTEGVDHALEGDSGVGIYKDYRGEYVIGAYRWLEERDMALLAEMDRSEAFIPIEALRNMVLRLGILVALGGALVSVLVASTITRPLEELIRGAEEIGRGNLDHRIRLESEDEVGQLAQAFNAMVENLQRVAASRDELDRERTQRKRIEVERIKAMEELERSNEELQRFAYIASHDLQEPLRMVTSYLQLLERRYGDLLQGDAQDFIAYAVDGATRMKQLINDLLTYSRVGTRDISFEPVDTQQIVGEVLDTLQFRIEEEQGEVISRSLPTVLGDKSQLDQLFQNLIENALKFRADGPPRIEVDAQKREGEWVFSVKDNGIGMDPKYEERVFIIFQRLHTQDEYEGTGVGLAVSKRIVERHGGEIWFESEPGKGTTFYFTIPDQPMEKE